MGIASLFTHHTPKGKDILSQFLAEAIVVSGVGGIIGVGFGIGVGLLLQAFDVSIRFTSGPMILAFSCATATGLVFGFAPARKAAPLPLTCQCSGRGWFTVGNWPKLCPTCQPKLIERREKLGRPR